MNFFVGKMSLHLTFLLFINTDKKNKTRLLIDDGFEKTFCHL